MATDRRALLAVSAAATSLLWPALWNGYPIVFADTGTYLSQAIHHYAGWDRPVFYSLFLLPLHATLTLWPVIIAQALLTAWVLWLVCRVLVPRLSAVAFVAGVSALSACTWLPWIVAELMPDVFTPLLILVTGLLCWLPERLSRREQVILVALATFMIASQLSSLPLACVLIAVLGLLRCCIRPEPPPARIEPASPDQHDRRYTMRPVAEADGLLLQISKPAVKAIHASPSQSARPLLLSAFRQRIQRSLSVTGKNCPVTIGPGWDQPSPRRRLLLLALPPVLAIAGLCSVNLAAHGRLAVSPFGNIFLLARVIYDGPGMAALERDCAVARWLLCPFVGSFPATSDEFLWLPDSPLYMAGGPKLVSRDADAIIQTAIMSAPAAEAGAAFGNAREQLLRFESGDGLEAWPDKVSPWIDRDFPAVERAMYAAALQQTGRLKVSGSLMLVHKVAALAGVAGAILLLPVALSRRAACAGLLLAVLLALPLSAVITGGMSAPHDRYQSRIMWLPAAIALVSLASLRRRPQVS